MKEIGTTTSSAIKELADTIIKPLADKVDGLVANHKALADTLTAEELLALDNETVLHRLYHEETVRLFEPQPLVFHCSCSRERSANALVSLGQADCERLLEEEEGSISIDCQFCN
ncbi:Hsp33 family molecular chaperone HslO, partial [Escherichia coli]|uniref:Hsp33 family molecular chaperone HslO n=1 Tax=Escherichia coli TaxID=562 RepID=UPI0023AF9341|nr:Hsp33 family molecular chaperone HslO [Escherichia coli]